MNARTPLPSGWLVPDWPVPEHVHAVFTTRAGGVSAMPWDTMNLGDHVGDVPAAVAANRDLLQRALGARPAFLRQVHGTAVADLDATETSVAEADACTTTRVGLACTMMVADCLPVLFADRQGVRVAAAHAGWRGLATGVLEATVGRFRIPTHSGRAEDAIDLVAWLGPCIGPRAFEVGDDVLSAFIASDPGAHCCFAPGALTGRWQADLPTLARRRLRALGVTALYGNDGGAGWCTVGNASRFFSHRRDARDGGGTGRMAACVWKTG